MNDASKYRTLVQSMLRKLDTIAAAVTVEERDRAYVPTVLRQIDVVYAAFSTVLSECGTLEYTSQGHCVHLPDENVALYAATPTGDKNI